MVSTRSRARVNKQVEAGPSGPANITPDLAAILDSQAKMQQELDDLKKRSADEMEALRQKNSRLRPRKHRMPQGPQLSNLLKKKASTTLPRTPSPPPNKLPSSQPIILTSIPPSQEILRLPPPPPPCPPHTSRPTTCPPHYTPLISHPTSLTPSLLPIFPLTTSRPLFPPSFTIPSLLTHYHLPNQGAVTLLPISSPTLPSPPSGNLSHWNVTLVKSTQTNTSRSTSPTSPSTFPMMSFFARPFLPPLKALPSNGLPPSRHTPLTASTPSPTCSPLTSPVAARTKLQQSHFSASDKNKTRRSRLSLIDSVRLPFAHHT